MINELLDEENNAVRDFVVKKYVLKNSLLFIFLPKSRVVFGLVVATVIVSFLNVLLSCGCPFIV